LGGSIPLPATMKKQALMRVPISIVSRGIRKKDHTHKWKLLEMDGDSLIVIKGSNLVTKNRLDIKLKVQCRICKKICEGYMHRESTGRYRIKL